eukprot:CAMPEP_0198117086 /NCGR_PEP_ID=MMETSP1442-20131203/16408_1 /TAXON_ID= /ORGANISM="Craspedostauros australis, Strain CCMP3328" /LENGTH=124 /DNA_ID=CAMNT_0043775055 /DNA_START=41 /DNA_END=415 /DNA_ORIENTATION=+
MVSLGAALRCPTVRGDEDSSSSAVSLRRFWAVASWMRACWSRHQRVRARFVGCRFSHAPLHERPSVQPARGEMERLVLLSCLLLIFVLIYPQEIFVRIIGQQLQDLIDDDRYLRGAAAGLRLTC